MIRHAGVMCCQCGGRKKRSTSAPLTTHIVAGVNWHAVHRPAMFNELLYNHFLVILSQSSCRQCASGDSSLIVVGSGHRLHVANLQFIVNLSAEEINMAQTETPRGSEQKKKKIKSRVNLTSLFLTQKSWAMGLSVEPTC